MADVLFVHVREDMEQAKALAAVFDAAGFSIDEGPFSEAAAREAFAGIVIWSDAAARLPGFVDAAAWLMEQGTAVIASLVPAEAKSVGATPVFDLSQWDGDPDDPLVDPLFFAVDRSVIAARREAAPARQRVAEPIAACAASNAPVLAEYAYWRPDIPTEVQARLNDGWLAATPTLSPARTRKAPQPERRDNVGATRSRRFGMPRASVVGAFIVGALMSGAIMVADIRFQGRPATPGAATYAEAEQAPVAPSVSFSEAAARAAPSAEPVGPTRRAIVEEPTPPPWTSWGANAVQQGVAQGAGAPVLDVALDVAAPLPPLEVVSVTPVALIEVAFPPAAPAIPDPVAPALAH